MSKLKVQNSPKLGLQELEEFGGQDHILWGIRKKWSRVDLSTPQIPDCEVYPNNATLTLKDCPKKIRDRMF